MKKSYLLIAMLGCSLSGMAQLVQVKSVRQVPTPDNLVVTQAQIAPSGNFLVVADQASAALTKIGIDGTDIQRIADNGSLLDIKIANDDKLVAYRQRVAGDDKLTRTAVRAVELSTGNTSCVIEPTRHFKGFSLNGATVTGNAEGRLQSRNIAGGKAETNTTVGIYRGHLCVNDGTADRYIDPQGPGSYLWPQISPDGTRIVYFKVHDGAFICNLDGSNPVALGYLQAPQWLDNRNVVGMQPFDDGTVITASALVVTDGKGVTQTIVDPSQMALYPSATSDGKSIAYTTPAGKLYLITLE